MLQMVYMIVFLESVLDAFSSNSRFGPFKYMLQIFSWLYSLESVLDAFNIPYTRFQSGEKNAFTKNLE